MMTNNEDDRLGLGTPSVAPFLERLRKVLSHDVRTPLGTIANYAAILEFQEDARPEDTRAFASRIRASSMRVAGLLSWAAEALSIPLRASQPAEVDVSSLLKKTLAEQSLVARFPARGPAPDERLVLDVDLVSYAWRSFLTVMSEASGGRSLELDLEVLTANGSSNLDLWIGTRDPSEPAFAAVEDFYEPVPSSDRSHACLGLLFAEELVRSRGGGLDLWGRPGATAGLRIRLPTAW